MTYQLSKEEPRVRERRTYPWRWNVIVSRTSEDAEGHTFVAMTVGSHVLFSERLHRLVCAIEGTDVRDFVCARGWLGELTISYALDGRPSACEVETSYLVDLHEKFIVEHRPRRRRKEWPDSLAAPVFAPLGAVAALVPFTGAEWEHRVEQFSRTGSPYVDSA